MSSTACRSQAPSPGEAENRPDRHHAEARLSASRSARHGSVVHHGVDGNEDQEPPPNRDRDPSRSLPAPCGSIPGRRSRPCAASGLDDGQFPAREAHSLVGIRLHGIRSFVGSGDAPLRRVFRRFRAHDILRRILGWHHAVDPVERPGSAPEPASPDGFTLEALRVARGRVERRRAPRSVVVSSVTDLAKTALREGRDPRAVVGLERGTVIAESLLEDARRLGALAETEIG
jgi:hypothetical protein